MSGLGHGRCRPNMEERRERERGTGTLAGRFDAAVGPCGRREEAGASQTEGGREERMRS